MELCQLWNPSVFVQNELIYSHKCRVSDSVRVQRLHECPQIVQEFPIIPRLIQCLYHHQNLFFQLDRYNNL